MKPWESEVPQVRERAEENGLVEANAEAIVSRRTPPKENSPERLVERGHGCCPGVLGTCAVGWPRLGQPDGTRGKSHCFPCVASLSLIREHSCAQSL